MNTPSPHRARKRFGQNFLRDGGIIRLILRAVAARPGDRIIEIGPGQGALTSGLLEGAGSLDVVELDRDLAAALPASLGHPAGLHIHQGDALRLKLDEQFPGGGLRIVGNLPYNISTPLLFHLLAQRGSIRDMHFMLQREVVERLGAAPGSRDWGRLGVMTQYHCRVEPLFEVPPEAFSPRPRVVSAVVRLTPHTTQPVSARSEASLGRVVATAFQQRRKTLRNALQTLLDEAEITAAGIDPGRRPDTLTLAEFVALADTFSARSEEPIR